MARYARGNPARWWKSRSCGSASRAPGSLFISPLRKYAGAGALTLLALFFAAIWYMTNPTRISRLSEGMLSKALGGHVTVKRGHLSWGGTLLLSGVDVRTADPEPMPAADVPIFSAEQIEVRFDWTSLFSGQLSATQLVATSPVFRPIEDRDSGHWNYERLRPPPGSSSAISASSAVSSLPVVMVRGARVEWGEIRNGQLSHTGETIIDGQLTPDATTTSLYRLLFTQSAPAAIVVQGDGGPPIVHDSVIRSDVGFILHGTWDVSKNIFNVSADNVVMSDALKRGMPRQAREWCEEHQLNGRLAQLSTTFSQEDGVLLSVQFDNVSMVWMVEPEQGIGMGEERPAYPVTVSNVRGSVVFSHSMASMKLSDVRGEVLGYQFAADCTLNGPSFDFDAPYEMKLRFPGAVLTDSYPPLFMAFLTSQDLIQRIEPHGKMDITVVRKRLVARGPVILDGNIECHDVGIRFSHLPYPLDHLNGRISFDQKSVTFHDVTARSDENTVSIRGTTGTSWNNPMIDFTVSSDNTVFDDRLGAALPAKFAAIWELFSLRGHGSFICRVTRSNALQGIPQVSVDVDLDDGSGFIRSVPYVFSQAKGHLHFEANESRIEHLTAMAGGDQSGRISLDGVVYHPGGDVNNLRPDLRLTADVPLDAALLHAFPEALAAKLKDIQLAGRMGFQGTMRHSAAAAHVATTTPAVAAAHLANDLEVTGQVKWTDGTLHATLAQAPIDFKAISAEAALTPVGLDLTGFDGLLALPGEPASQESARIHASGKLDLTTMASTVQITADADSLTLPAHSAVWFPKRLSETWESASPSGKIGLHASASLRIHEPNAGESGLQSRLTIDDFTANLVARDIALKPPGLPERLSNLRGAVEVRPGLVTMKEMTGKLDSIDLAWSGQLNTAAGSSTLKGDAVSPGLPVKWLSYLPADLARSLDAKREGTMLALHLDELSRPTADAPWKFSGTLATNQFAVLEPMAMSSARANLVAHGTYAPAAGGKLAALDFSGVMAATDVTISDRLVNTLTARVDVVAADKSIHITEISGKVAGGVLSGRIHIDTELPMPNPATTQSAEPGIAATIPGPGGFQAELSLLDAQLAGLLPPVKPTDDDKNKVGTGLVSASLTLDQRFGPQASRTGHGDFTVHDGNIYNVPLSMGLLQIATFRLPMASSFHHANMHYSLMNDEISFDRILLESKGINLAGAGTLSMATKAMNFSFVTETPNELFIPIISPIIRETRNELLQVSITGTLDSPKVTPVPLSMVSNTLRALLPPATANAAPSR